MKKLLSVIFILPFFLLGPIKDTYEKVTHYDNGHVKRIEHYKWGKLYGKTVEYYKSYKDKEKINILLNYKYGILEGKALHYYSNGRKKYERNYQNGKLHGEFVEYYENGNLRFKEFYQNGRLFGEALAFYKNGTLRYKANHDEKIGILNGEMIEYYENGKIKVKSSYKQGYLHGKLTKYYNNGKVEFEEVWNRRRRETLIQKGMYYNYEGVLVSKITKGTGTATYFYEDRKTSFERKYRGGRHYYN